MISAAQSFRFSAATGLHRGDRAYQQDQVEIITHPRIHGAVLAMVADGMGGKSGGRKAADQVLLTGRQIFERFSPGEDDARELLRQLVLESHLMIKLTAITAESRTARWRPFSSAPGSNATWCMPATRASITSAAPR